MMKFRNPSVTLDPVVFEGNVAHEEGDRKAHAPHESDHPNVVAAHAERGREAHVVGQVVEDVHAKGLA